MTNRDAIMEDHKDKTEKAENKDKKGSRKWKYLLLLLILIAAAAAGIFLWNYYQKEKQAVSDRDARMGIMPGMSEEDIQERLNQTVAEGMMNVSINPSPVFKDGKSKGNLRIENIKANHYSYIITIYLEEGNELVYQSGLLAPGYYIENAKLKKNLKKGNYPATALFEAYQEGREETIGAAAVKIILRIQN